MELESKKVSKEERERRIQGENELVSDRILLFIQPEYLRE